jgi:hypothetical protein
VDQPHGAVMQATSAVITSPASPASARRHTLGMVYCRVFSGMRVTIETQVLRFPTIEVDWPHKAVGIYSWDHSQVV